MKLVVASDSYKGSLSALEVGEAIKTGAFQASQEIQVTNVPMADGGEGTIEAILANKEGRTHELEVHDPLMRKVTATYAGIQHNGHNTAVIECAQSTGLPLIEENKRNPMLLNSFGLGEQIADAIHKGYEHIIITLGGSATNDGGIGMLQALGFQFYDAHKNEIPVAKNPIVEVQSFSGEGQLPDLDQCTITIASDVSNPFYGPNGATYIFGPQKGATPSQQEVLDKAFHNLSRMFSAHYGKDVQAMKGSGAAGGLGGAIAVCLNGQFEPGIDVVMDIAQLDASIQEADLVITGEGSMDNQSMMGKVPHGVSKLAKKHSKPIIGLAGRYDLDTTQLNHHLDAIFSIQSEAHSLEKAMQSTMTQSQLVSTSEQIVRLFMLKS